MSACACVSTNRPGACALTHVRRHSINNNVSTPQKKELARKLSAMSTVLLQRGLAKEEKFESMFLLPLNKSLLKAKDMSIVLIGADAAAPYVAGQGSGGVHDSDRLVSPLAAFEATGLDVKFEPANTTDALAAALEAAGKADIAIVFASAHSGEGHDRADLYLSGQTQPVPMEEIITFVSRCDSPKCIANRHTFHHDLHTSIATPPLPPSFPERTTTRLSWQSRLARSAPTRGELR